MAGRMLRVLSSKQSVYRQLLVARNQVSAPCTKSLFREDVVYSSNSIRQFSVFNEFSKQFKGEAKSNEDFQRSVKELKEKAEELKGVKEDLKVRTKQTTEQLYKHVDGVWTEAEAAAKKVSANLKEKVSAATEEVKESFGIGKQDASDSSSAKDNSEQKPNDSKESSSGEETQQKTESTDTSENIFSKVKSTISPKVSLAFQKIKEASPIDFAKKGYNIVRDELSGNSSKRKRIEYEVDESAPKVERSSATGIVVVPVKQSKWSKKWEAFKQKMHGNPVFKRVSGLSEPVVSKGQELAEDMRERWETSDNPVVHKIQDLNESVFGETTAAMSFKEIRRRDPSFSLPDFVSEVREVIRPVLTAYYKGDNETLKKYCSPEVITRCMAEHKAYAVADIFFDNKILHISEVEVRETKMMEDRPIIIVAFQTQQVYCIRDKLGQIKEGGTDTIHTVYYMWAMQQFDVQDLGEGALFPIWRLREMQQQGVQALI
jgi:import inner membrane translocase subunit TIM44